MQNSTTDNDAIDWKKIGNSEPTDSTRSVASASIATPQKPILPKTTIPLRSSAVIRHSKENKTTEAAVKVSPYKQENQNVPNVKNVDSPVRKHHSDIGGMEMLDTEFILQVIENLQETDHTDLIMRKIGFGEILRRDLTSMIDSTALKAYATDSDTKYGKRIQCNAMQELARRTA